MLHLRRSSIDVTTTKQHQLEEFGVQSLFQDLLLVALTKTFAPLLDTTQITHQQGLTQGLLSISIIRRPIKPQDVAGGMAVIVVEATAEANIVSTKVCFMSTP